MTAVKTAVCIVTYDSADDLPGCFEALAAQDVSDFEVVVVDCASRDGSVEAARQSPLGRVPRKVVPLDENRGFAGGMNVAFRRTTAPRLLTLNADTRPRPDFLRRLGERLAAGTRTGAVTPRLVRPAEDGGAARLDACGMMLVKTWRHLDRGSGEVDRGQYAAAERVFGGTGAATLFAREALEDVAFADGEVFDPLFHSFREDAELCFRLQGRGWDVVYEPAAVAVHRRRVLPEGRRRLPPEINLGSIKNRYLLRAYHDTWRSLGKTLLPASAREVGAFVYMLLAERSSLAVYPWLWRHRQTIAARRRYVQGRRTAPPGEVEAWFGRPSLPLEEGR